MDKMLDEMVMPKRARTIIDLAQVKKGEQVLLLCDFTTAGFGKLLASEVYQRDALPILTVIPPLKAHGVPVPEPVVEMAKRVDILIAALATLIAHTPLRTEALKAGVRVMILPYADEKFLASRAFDVDFHEVKPRVEKMARLLTESKVARVTTAGGTDLTMNIGGRDGRALTGFCQKGILACPPGIEALVSPLEGTSKGKIVDAVSIMSLPAELDLAGRLLNEPIELVVDEGLVKEIRGGLEAGQLKEFLKSMNDPNVYNIAELGVGLHPHVEKFDGSFMDESVQGSVHIGIGENWCFPGGKIKSDGHYDFVVPNVTLELDGRAVIKDGKLLI